MSSQAPAQKIGVGYSWFENQKGERWSVSPRKWSTKDRWCFSNRLREPKGRLREPKGTEAKAAQKAGWDKTGAKPGSLIKTTRAGTPV